MHAFAPDLVLLTSSLVDIRSLYNPAIASNASEVELLQQSITAGWLARVTDACQVVKVSILHLDPLFPIQGQEDCIEPRMLDCSDKLMLWGLHTSLPAIE